MTYVCSEVKIKRKPQRSQRKKSAKLAEKKIKDVYTAVILSRKGRKGFNRRGRREKNKRCLYHRQFYHAKGAKDLTAEVAENGILP